MTRNEQSLNEHRDALKRAINVAVSLKRNTVVVGINDLSALMHEHAEQLKALTMILAASHGRGKDGALAMSMALDQAREAIAKVKGAA